MHKVVSFTINARVFNIEDDAFFALKDYLDAIKKGLGTDEEGFEVLNDIESSIADKFTEKLKANNRTVLTLVDVTELKNVMGNPEDISGNEDKEEKGKEEVRGEDKTRKKLYRDTDNQMIGGVCSGLASYFKIDPVLVRLIFVALLFLNGIGLLLYVVLLIVMPAAKTPAQKLEMQGEAVNLAKIKSYVSEKANEMRNDGIFQRTVNIVRRLFVISLRLVLIVIGIGLVVGAVGALLGLTIGGVVMLFSGYEAGILPFSIANIISWPVYLLALLSVFFVAVIPLIFLILAGLSILRKKNTFRLGSSLGLVALWIIAIAAMIGLGINYGAKIEQAAREYNLKRQNISLVQENYRVYDYKDFKNVEVSGSYSVNINKGDNFAVEVRGADSDLDRLLITNNNGTLSIRSNNFWCFGSCQYMTATVNITMPNLEKLFVNGLTQTKATDVAIDRFTVDANGLAKVTIEGTTAQQFIARLNGLSVVEVSGQIDRLGAELNGTSQLDALRAPARTANLNLQGASTAKVDVGGSIRVRANGVSKVYYKSVGLLDRDFATEGMATVEAVK